MNGRHHTHHNVIFKTKPERRIGCLDASLVLIAVHDLPPHRTGRFQGFGERFLLRRDQEKRTEIGIGLLLLCGHLWATVLGGIGCISPQWQDRHKGDRKSTRLNSSHLVISYAVFCLKKKKKKVNKE